jgi:hypothetical protein
MCGEKIDTNEWRNRQLNNNNTLLLIIDATSNKRNMQMEDFKNHKSTIPIDTYRHAEHNTQQQQNLRCTSNTSLNKYERIKIIQSTFSNHNRIKLEKQQKQI